MTTRPTVLVPVRVLEGESIPEGIHELLANTNVVLLGYHVIPDQTAPGQAQLQFEERAGRRLDEYAHILEAAGATVERRLVFTHNGQQTIDRIAREHECGAILVPNATSTLDDVLVAVRGSVGFEQIAQVVAGVFGGRDATVTLYHVAPDEESDEDADTLLDGLTRRLVNLGVDETAIETRVDRDRAPVDAIAETATEFDVAVVGETDPSLSTFVFGMPADNIADRFLGPVLVVQRDAVESEDEE